MKKQERECLFHSEYWDLNPSFNFDLPFFVNLLVILPTKIYILLSEIAHAQNDT